MKKVKMLFFAAAMGLIALPGCKNEPSKNPEERAEEANEAKTETNRAEEDAETLVQAAVNGMMEIQSSQVAASMATQPSVKEFANMMITEHTNMSNEVKSLASKKGFTLPAALDADHQEDIEDMKKWAKGKEFDNKYIEEQIDMHEKTLDELENRMAKTADSDLKMWAEKAAASVRTHLGRAKQINDEIDAIYK
jgi:putative membrane protein